MLVLCKSSFQASLFVCLSIFSIRLFSYGANTLFR